MSVLCQEQTCDLLASQAELSLIWASFHTPCFSEMTIGSVGQSGSPLTARPLTFNDRRVSLKAPALQSSNRNDLTRQGRAGILAVPDAFDATHRSCT